jgi:hypothetical protein
MSSVPLPVTVVMDNQWFNNQATLAHTEQCKKDKTTVLVVCWRNSVLRNDLLDGLHSCACIQLGPDERAGDAHAQELIHSAWARYRHETKIWGACHSLLAPFLFVSHREPAFEPRAPARLLSLSANRWWQRWCSRKCLTRQLVKGIVDARARFGRRATSHQAVLLGAEAAAASAAASRARFESCLMRVEGARVATVEIGSFLMLYRCLQTKKTCASTRSQAAQSPSGIGERVRYFRRTASRAQATGDRILMLQKQGGWLSSPRTSGPCSGYVPDSSHTRVMVVR